MTPEKAFGQVLRDLRTKRNLSQEKLALEGGLDRTFISLLERGLRQPSLITIFQISKVLNLSPDEVIRKVVEKMNTR